jgi:hypothetical protein
VVPSRLDKILEIDPVTKGLQYYTVSGGTTNTKFGFRCIYGDKIYSLPFALNLIMEFDVITKVIQYYPLTYTGTTNYNSPSCVQQGAMVYAFPASQSSVLRFNLDTKALDYFGNFGPYSPTATKFYSNFAIGDKLYALPYNYTALVEFDPATSGITEYGTFVTGSRYLYGYVDGSVLYASLYTTGTSNGYYIFNTETKEGVMVNYPVRGQEFVEYRGAIYTAIREQNLVLKIRLNTGVV